MKEATGELNMTVVTLIAIAAIGAIFYFVVWPLIQRQVVNQSCRTTYGPTWHAVSGATADVSGGNTQATVKEWFCCPDGIDTVTTTDSNGNSVNDSKTSCHKAND